MYSMQYKGRAENRRRFGGKGARKKYPHLTNVYWLEAPIVDPRCGVIMSGIYRIYSTLSKLSSALRSPRVVS
jgi:hypothetical protein